MDAAFEVAIPGKNGCDDEVVIRDFLRDVFGKRAGVADACRAAIADQIETKLVEERPESGLFEIVRHHFRTGRKTRLHPGLRLQATFDRTFREQARTIITEGFDVFVQLVIAAITTAPSLSFGSARVATAVPPPPSGAKLPGITSLTHVPSLPDPVPRACCHSTSAL